MNREREQKEEELRNLAARSRAERSGLNLDEDDEPAARGGEIQLFVGKHVHLSNIHSFGKGVSVESRAPCRSSRTALHGLTHLCSCCFSCISGGGGGGGQGRLQDRLRQQEEEEEEGHAGMSEEQRVAAAQRYVGPLCKSVFKVGFYVSSSIFSSFEQTRILVCFRSFVLHLNLVPVASFKCHLFRVSNKLKDGIK